MLCPNCQHRNPDENRFCGNCGCDLTKFRTIYPREGYDESDLPAVSDVDPDVPRFRRDVPPLPQSEYGPVTETPDTSVPESSRRPEDREPAPVRQSVVVPHADSPTRTPREEARSFGSSTGIIFNLDPREPSRGRESSEPLEPVASEPEMTRRSEGIHGPSFLGLGEPDFLDDIDDGEESHSRRNWLLFALLIVVVLAVVQWRNIRDTGLQFAGSMKLNLPHKKGEPAKPAETASTDVHSESGPANNGKPEMVVNPENNGADKKASDNSTQSAANSDNAGAQQGSEGQKSNILNSDNSTTAKNDGAKSNSAKPSDNQPTEQAKNSSPDKNAAAGEDDSGDTADKEPAAKTPTKPAAKSKARAAAPKSEPASAGAEELARANSASSPETAAKWLWASTSKGNLDAPVRLADMYATGRGVPKDCEQANVLLRSSARRGNPRASARLGMYYATGQCVQQDRAQAWRWLSTAHKADPASDWIAQYRQRLWSQMTPDERARAGNGPTSSASE